MLVEAVCYDQDDLVIASLNLIRLDADRPVYFIDTNPMLFGRYSPNI